MALLLAPAAYPPPGALSGAVAWLDHVLTGPLATGLAVIAVAWFGLLLLQGRGSIRRGGLVLVGCFVLFGAPAMAQELLGFAEQVGAGTAVEANVQPATAQPPAPPSPPAYDPYAGASLPIH